MRTYLLRRVLLFIPTLIIVSVGIFLMLRVAPGDIAVLTVLGSGEPLIQDRLEAARQVEEFRVLHGGEPTSPRGDLPEISSDSARRYSVLQVTVQRSRSSSRSTMSPKPRS